MTARLLLLFLALTLACGCSKKSGNDASRGKTGTSAKDGLKKIKPFIVDQAPSIQHPLDVEFEGGKVALLGYNLTPEGVVPQNQKIKLTLYWRVRERLGGFWRLYTYALDGSGDRVLDLWNKSPLRTGKKGHPILPVSAWEPGKVYVDELSFKLPSNLKTEQVRIATGIYDKNKRMAVTKGEKDSQNRVVVSLEVALGANAGAGGLPSVKLEKLESGVKIKIDGKLDEPAWASAPVLGPFVDVKSGEPNKTFPVNGKARLLWNEQGLFVGCEVEDKDVVGGFKKGEKDPHLWTRDAVELMIDPDGDGDNQDYYEIQINPQNLVFDSQFDKYNEPRQEPDGPFGHQDWSSNLKSAVVVNGTLDKSDDQDTGYVVEAMVPWKSFGKAKHAPPALGDSWRLNLYAMQQNSGVAWSAILGQGNFHKASRFGMVRFTAKGLSAAPSASGSTSAVPSASAAPASLAPSARTVAPKPVAPKPAASAPH